MFNDESLAVDSLKKEKKILNLNSSFDFKLYLLKIIANQCHALFQFK